MNIKEKFVLIPIITRTRESSLRKIFFDEFIYNKEKLFLESYPVVIFPEDFNHICFESATGSKYKEKFSLKRARKILIIKDICLGKLPYQIIFQEKRENRSLCILLDYVEFAIFLLPQRSKKGTFLRLLTIISYGKQTESIINKQKRNGVLVENIDEAVRLRGSTASKSRQINKYLR